jgi:hypothetical protein
VIEFLSIYKSRRKVLKLGFDRGGFKLSFFYNKRSGYWPGDNDNISLASQQGFDFVPELH